MTSAAASFEAFWARYPRKVGKLAALKAYQRARGMASAADILAGLETYLQHLPDEARFVVHPTSWLNQGRWMDSYEPVAHEAPLREDRSTCQHEPRCSSNAWHAVRLGRDRGAA